MDTIIQFWDEDQNKYVEVSQDTPLPVSLAAGEIDTAEIEDGAVTTPKIADSAVTTAKIADGAVTDDKLANPKVDVPPSLIPGVVIGTTLSTADLGLVGYSQSPMADQLVMYQFGGQVATSAPQADGDAATKKYVDDKTYPFTAITGTATAAQIPTLDQSKITNLTTDLAAKLTATQAAAQADSTATDVAGLVTDFNAFLAKLRTAGIIAT